MHNFCMCWCGMIEWTHARKKIKVNLTENAWNNLGQLTWTLPRPTYRNFVGYTDRDTCTRVSPFLFFFDTAFINKLAPLNGASDWSGTIFRTNNRHVCRHVGFTPNASRFHTKSMLCCRKQKINNIPCIPIDVVTLSGDLEIMHYFWRLTEIP